MEVCARASSRRLTLRAARHEREDLGALRSKLEYARANSTAFAYFDALKIPQRVFDFGVAFTPADTTSGLGFYRLLALHNPSGGDHFDAIRDALPESVQVAATGCPLLDTAPDAWVHLPRAASTALRKLVVVYCEINDPERLIYAPQSFECMPLELANRENTLFLERVEHNAFVMPLERHMVLADCGHECEFPRFTGGEESCCCVCLTDSEHFFRSGRACRLCTVGRCA
jgi:hypothetical protein